MSMIVSATGIDAVRVGVAWAPTLIFLTRETMTLADPDSVTSVEVLSGDGQTVLETIDGADLVRASLGRYTVSPALLVTAGVAFLRVTFVLDAVEGPPDILRFLVLPALGDDADASGGSSILTRVYTCPSFLTEAQFDTSAMTAGQIWELIRDVSAQIEALTNGNIFNAEYGEFACSGRARRIIYHPLQMPFCKVDLVELDGDRTDHSRDGLFRYTYHACGVETISATRYTLRAGMVESIHKDFPAGAMNVTVTGAIGSPQPAHYAATTSTTAVGPASNYVNVANLTGFHAKDVVEIIGDAGSLRTIATRLDAALGRIYFDAAGGAFNEIATEAVVRTFGQVPRNITLVANYLFGVAMRERDANANGDEFIPAGRVRRERTDNYEIEFQLGDASESLTGSPRYDRLLHPYMKPIDVRFP